MPPKLAKYVYALSLDAKFVNFVRIKHVCIPMGAFTSGLKNHPSGMRKDLGN